MERVLQRLQLDEAKIAHYGPKGCDACQNTGYAGRVGVYELLRITPGIKEMILRKASEPDLNETAVRNGMVPLLSGSIELVRQGITTVEEVLRVIQLQDEGLVRCPSCAVLIDRDFASCPYCAHALKTVCESCEQQLKPGWRICPYCSAPVSAPAASAPAPARKPAEPPAAHTADPKTTPRILVVDDDPVMRAIVTRAVSLLSQKPEILQAAGGEEGFRMATESKPDIILLDVMMPEMNGIEVCQKLRSNIQTAFVPVLMLTASTDEETRSKGFLVGTDDFMSKPISVPELHARVNRLLRRTYGI